jgi:DNA-binding CsgD family transcriptional regulator
MAPSETSLARASGPFVVANEPVIPGPLSDQARILYRWLANRGPCTPHALTRLQLPGIEQAIGELVALGLVRRHGETVVARPYPDVLHEVMSRQVRTLDRAVRRLSDGQRLLHVLINEHQALSGDATDTVRSLDPPGAGQDLVEQSALRARHRLATLNPSSDYPDEVLAASLERAAADLERGVALQALHQRSMLAQPRRAQYLWELERLGAQVRLREYLPFRMMVFDDRAAGCSINVSATVTETFLLRGERLVMLLSQMFDSLWLEAEPLPTPSTEQRNAPLVSSLTPQHLTILRCLADGATDQAIARALGITPRTVTRRLNEIYSALGVQSRFQAGSAARKLGLV